ncbi:hypothetical protein [Actinomycetospora chibensis]|uniref:Uncharacterized protein n=1 Tax=Actinomycetospora chibensis TaxID=663606 RepID=A0ABV9RRG9_9PSEU|nr:hypothetical protein [Actinomycetospora chibensis]MDD7923694.1 hypothetical protein [Actinomycetospora chibensis]
MDGAVAGDAAGVLVEPEGGGEPQSNLHGALPEAPGTTFDHIERPEQLGGRGQVGEIEQALLRR